MTPTIGRSKNGNPCAWCCREFGIDAEVGSSHGICERHLAELKAEIAAKRARRLLQGALQ